MPNVRVTCLMCDHAIEVPAAEVVLHLGAPAATPVDRYGFTCPRCDAFVVRRASRRVVEALIGTWEVQISTAALPPWEQADRPDVLLAESGVALDAADLPPRPDAAPIDEADVLLFRQALEDDAILAAWVAAD